MIKIILMFALSFNLYAGVCRNSVPTSEAQRYIDNISTGVSPLFKCEDKPTEKCHCVDHIVWEYADIVNNEVINSELKKAEYLTAKFQNETLKEQKKLKRKEAKELLKSLDFENATTLVKLRPIIKALIEAQDD